MPDLAEEDFNTPEEVDEVLTELSEAVGQAEQGDLAVAIEQLRDATEVVDGEVELPDDLTLPFYEEDREIAFAIGLTVGALLEAKKNAAADDDEDTQTEAGATVEQSQEQSVTVTA